jgi:ATP-dependent RNA helicase MSS116, mitochondrial
MSTTSQRLLPEVSTPPLTEAVPQDTMRFVDLAADLHPTLIETITQDLGFDHMTPVQEATLHELLHNRVDCLAQAKTGTGKTVAFLLPAIQTLMNKRPTTRKKVSLLVISPTRELALQIAKEASSLLGRLPQYKVQWAIGGTNKDREERDILGGCDILIATPGRLKDHFGNPTIVELFSNLDTLVLDEADRLLDMGFAAELKAIISYLPNKEETKRQGMLFSATIADHVNKFAHLALSPGYKFISTIPAGEINTHEHVTQLLVTVPDFKDVLPATISTLRREVVSTGINNFKAIIFCPTAAQADWFAESISQAPGLPPVSILHSRMSQSKRTNVTNAYRTASSAILIATDVVARGMDFPNVSTVVQIDLPMDKESYIHRLGRTARAGREGRGIFIIAEAESFFPKYRLKEIAFVPTEADISPQDTALVQKTAANSELQGKVYQAWLGYYKSHMKALSWTPEQLVQHANRYAIDALCAGGVPELQKSTVGKMGLKGVKGLNVVANAPHVGRGGQGNAPAKSGASAGRGGQANAPADSSASAGPGSWKGGRRMPKPYSDFEPERRRELNDIHAGRTRRKDHQ